MEFVTDKGIRFTQKEENFSLQNFISEGQKRTTVVLEDIIIDFNEGSYIETYKMPF